MQQHELDALFDQQAAGYDAQWARMAPIRESLLFLLESVFADLPEDARVLCVGAGTGAEIAHLARRFPRWRFLALDPSHRMIDACRARAERDGYIDRCTFHAGLLETLPGSDPFDGATCFLVSQFLLDTLSRDVDVGNLDGKARLAALARPLLTQLPEGVYRELLTEELANRVGLPRRRLEELMGAGASQASTTDKAQLHRPNRPVRPSAAVT